MITRIEIDGFKSFHNFAVDLRPFQVFIGTNGVGKSNLFDAIVLLSNLAGDNTLYDAFRNNRGDISELFTSFPDGSRANKMRFGVEMLIAKTVTDELGVTENVSSTRVRYRLEIERRLENGLERPFVAYESLTAITAEDDEWFKPNIPVRNRAIWVVRGRRPPYISTSNGYIYKHQDKRSGARKQETPVGKIERTILSTISNTEYPTAFAVRQEMLSWQFLQFNPFALRAPSSVFDKTVLKPDGSNLAAVLWRMSREEPTILNDISIEMSNLVAGILDVRVEWLREREQFLIRAAAKDGSVFSSRVLSDGTLRLLALVTLKHDPMHQGVLSFEEPENGVHPLRLQRIVDVLKSLATDFNADLAEEDDDALESVTPRQVLINTHSPKLMDWIAAKDMMFVYMPPNSQRQTRMAPVKPELLPDEQEQWYVLSQVRLVLDRAESEFSL